MVVVVLGCSAANKRRRRVERFLEMEGFCMYGEMEWNDGVIEKWKMLSVGNAQAGLGPWVCKIRPLRNQDYKNKESTRRNIPVEIPLLQLWCHVMVLVGMTGVIRQKKDLIMHLWLTHLQVLTQSQIVDNCKKGLGYNAVLPPYIGNFIPPTPDLSFTGLDEFVNKPVVENRKSDEEVSKNMVPRAVLMKSGLVSINTARQVNAAHTKTTVNAAKQLSYLSKKAHSTVKRKIHKNTSFKNSNFNQRVNTVKDKNVNTIRPKAVVNAARPKAVVNAVKGNNVNDVQLVGFGNQRLKSYLTDYEEIDEGYVAFGGNPKGGKIIGKEPKSYLKMIGCKPLSMMGKEVVEDSRKDFEGFEDPDFPDRVYKVKKALYGLHQAPRAWFTEVKTVSTPIETQKPMLKDENGEEVDVHMYRSMIGSLMYLTS
ncbi:ribonuclease H-like domain-containing protein [Tanacetum coccineum]